MSYAADAYNGLGFLFDGLVSQAPPAAAEVNLQGEKGSEQNARPGREGWEEVGRRSV